MGSKKKKNSREQKKKTSREQKKNSPVCVFCKCSNLDEVNLGGLKSIKNVYAHYYCLLFSDTIQQSGQDNQGILGFMYTDIVNELRQTKDRECCYCKEMNANLTCRYTVCNRKFHYPCGLANNSQHNFNTFSSLCSTHRKVTNIPVYIKRCLNEYSCVICLEHFDSHDNISNLIWANCCKSDIVFHRHCIQQLALNAGYFTKCPGCNNKTEFVTTIKSLGVFVPERDASWELERNAFSELLYVHKTCDVSDCVCPEGRNFVMPRGQWKLTLCKLCGSFGTHVSCTKIKRDFVCDLCKIITERKAADIEQRSEPNTEIIQTRSRKAADIEPRSEPNTRIIQTRSYDFSNSVANVQVCQENHNNTLQEKPLVAHLQTDSVMDDITNDPICSQNEKVSKEADDLSITFNTSTPSVQPLKENEKTIACNDKAIPSTSQFLGNTRSFSLKRKISILESDCTEKNISYKRPCLENMLESIESKRNYSECDKFQTENSTPDFEIQKKRVNSLTSVHKPSDSESIKNYNYNLENVNEEVYLIKKLSNISNQCDNAKDDNTKMSCDCSQEVSTNNEVNVTEYKILLDTNSEIEFITRPDVNITNKNSSDVKPKTKNVDATLDFSLNGTVTDTEVITAEKENSCTSDHEITEAFESTSTIPQNSRCTENTALDNLDSDPSHRNRKKVISIHFRNRYINRLRTAHLYYKWNFPFLQSM